MTDAYAAAFCGEVPVGCLGISYALPSGFFPVERLYGLRREEMQLPIDEANTVEFGRFVSTDRDLTPLLAYAVMRFARGQGRAYGLLEHTDAVHRVITARLGLRFYSIPHARLDLHQVEPADVPFYERNVSRPYLIDLVDSSRKAWTGLPEDHRALVPSPP
jgi:GNAT superfamily N-acetyltransferase